MIKQGKINKTNLFHLFLNKTDDVKFNFLCMCDGVELSFLSYLGSLTS